MFTLKPPGPRLRLALLASGVLTFMWLGLEDNNTLSVTVLGTLVSVFGVLMAIHSNGPRMPLPPRVWLPGFALTGALIGGAAILITIVLMFFKTAWHGHAFPDYPVPLLAAMLTRLPLWMVGGACIGLGLGVWQWVKQG